MSVPLYWENELRKANQRAARLAADLKAADDRAWQLDMILDAVAPDIADLYDSGGYDAVMGHLNPSPAATGDTTPTRTP